MYKAFAVTQGADVDLDMIDRHPANVENQMGRNGFSKYRVLHSAGRIKPVLAQAFPLPSIAQA